MSQHDITFEYTDNGQSKYLICPQCANKLSAVDIEEYLTCPYCDYAFRMTPEIEEFLLSPLVKEWSRRIYPNFNDSSRS